MDLAVTGKRLVTMLVAGEAIGNEVKDDEFELEDIFDGFAMAAKFRPASRRLLST